MICKKKMLDRQKSLENSIRTRLAKKKEKKNLYANKKIDNRNVIKLIL